MNKIHLNKAISQIYQACEERDSKTPFFFIVGAGISAPLVSTAYEVIKECKTIAQKYGRGKESEFKNSMKEYSYWFEEAFPHKEQRQNFLKYLIEGKAISPANLRLAHLLESKKVANLVVTPNFDDFLVRALNIFGTNCIICDHPNTVGKVDPEKDDIQIVHVHGTYQFYDCSNLRHEIEEVATKDGFLTMKSFLERTLSRRTPLVVGYSGWEDDVIMSTLKKRLESPLPYNIYWFCYRESNLQSLPKWLKENNNVFFVVPNERKNFNEINELVEDESMLEEEKLEAVDVFSKMIESFNLELPLILKDPIGYYIEYFEKSIPKAENEGTYYFDTLLKRLKTAKEHEKDVEAKKEESEKIINTVKEAIGKYTLSDITSLITQNKIKELDVLHLEQLLQIIWSTINMKNIETNLILGMYDIIINICNRLIIFKPNSNDIIIKKVRVKYLKALKLVKDDNQQALSIFNEITEVYVDNEENDIIKLVIKSCIQKAKLMNKPDLSLQILNEVISRYGNIEHRSITIVILSAKLEKAKYIVDKKEEIDIYDEIIKEYNDSKDEDIKVYVAICKLYKMYIVRDKEDKLTIIDNIVEDYGKDKNEFLKILVFSAKDEKISLIENEYQKVSAYDNLIQEFSNCKDKFIRRKLVQLKLEKSEIIKDIDEQLKIYDDIILEYENEENEEIEEYVIIAKLKKASYFNENEKKIEIYDEIINKYNGKQSQKIQKIVVETKYLKATYINSREEKIKIVDDIIENYTNSDVNEIQHLVVHSLLIKVINLEKIEGKIKTLNQIINKYDDSKDETIIEIVGTAYNYLGFELYKMGVIKEAANCFYKTYNKTGNGLNLAYMIRRAEVNRELYPSIKELLSTSIDEKDPTALVNFALCYAFGIEVEQDWGYADQLIKSIEDASSVLAWWNDLDDIIEKNLVLGWLVKNNIVTDPEGVDYTERFKKVKDNGINIPSFLLFREENDTMKIS